MNELIIRPMTEQDREVTMAMMNIFYRSPAVIATPPDDVLLRDFDDCVGECPFAEGYIFSVGGEIAGYGMVAKSYSTEAGGICIWIEDIFILESFRHQGIGSRFLSFLEEKYRSYARRLRLEVEHENVPAYAAYTKAGFRELPYVQMIKDI